MDPIPTRPSLTSKNAVVAPVPILKSSVKDGETVTVTIPPLDTVTSRLVEKLIDPGVPLGSPLSKTVTPAPVPTILLKVEPSPKYDVAVILEAPVIIPTFKVSVTVALVKVALVAVTTPIVKLSSCIRFPLTLVSAIMVF